MTDPKKNRTPGEIQLHHSVSKALVGNLDLDQILYVILSGITHGDGLGFNRAFLFLADEGGRELRVATAVGPTSEAEAHRIWEAMESQELDLETLLKAYDAAGRDPLARALPQRLAGFVVPLSVTAPPIREGEGSVPLQVLIVRSATLKEPFFLNKTQADFQPPPAAGGEPLSFAHLAVVPLLLGDSVLGVLLADNLFSGREVGPQDLLGLASLGNLAAVAVDKARLHQRLKEMAALDGLTGVFNRRHYELRLQQEMDRARRNGRPLSLLILDIDHFKASNTAQGHETGDRALRDLAGILRERVRAEDLVARIGGEEFVVLLTGGATPEESIKVAEKLRNEVQSRSLGGRPAGELTVSVGVSTQTADRLDATTLYSQAENALATAKKTGRNRVVPSP